MDEHVQPTMFGSNFGPTPAERQFLEPTAQGRQGSTQDAANTTMRPYAECIIPEESTEPEPANSKRDDENKNDRNATASSATDRLNTSIEQNTQSGLRSLHGSATLTQTIRDTLYEAADLNLK